MFYTDIQNIFRNSPDKNSPINYIQFSFPKYDTAFFFPSCKNNLIVQSIILNILICRPSVRLSEWTFQGLCTCSVERERMEVRRTRHQFLCDKTREISEVINFHCAFRFSWLILMHHYIPSKLVNINLPTLKGNKFSFV